MSQMNYIAQTSRRDEEEMKEDSLRRELVERIQHVKRLEDGLVQRLSFTERIQQELRLFEPLMSSGYHDNGGSHVRASTIGNRDHRLLVDQDADRVDHIKIADEEISKNQEIVPRQANSQGRDRPTPEQNNRR